MYELLTKQDQKRIDVFIYLYSHGNSTIKKVANNMNISPLTVSNIIEDVRTHNELLKDQIDEEKGQITVKDLDLNIVLNYYLKNSVMFEMIRALLKEGTINQEEFEKRLFVSQPTFSRNRARLKKILKKFSIELNSKNDLEGSEYIIRKFFYYFYTNISGYIPLDQNDLNTRIQRLYSVAPFLDDNDHSRNIKIYRILKINAYRIRQKKYIDKDIHINEEVSPLISEMMKKNSNYITSHSISNANRKKEIKNFIYTLYCEYVTDFGLTNDELVKLFEVPDETFNQVEKHIVDTVIKEVSFPDIAIPEINSQIDELVNRFHLEMLYGMIDRSFFEIVESTRDSLHVIEKKIVDEAEQIYKRLSNNSNYLNWITKNKINIEKDVLVTQIFFLLYKGKIYKLKSDKTLSNFEKIKIMIQMSHPEVERFVQTRFELLFWNQVVFVNGISQKPDFIIADINYPEYKGIKVYNLASIPTIEQTESIMLDLSRNVLDMFLERVM